jgi:hypothetical protein
MLAMCPKPLNSEKIERARINLSFLTQIFDYEKRKKEWRRYLEAQTLNKASPPPRL